MQTKPKTKGQVHRITVDLPMPLYALLRARREALGASYQRTVELALEAYLTGLEAHLKGLPDVQAGCEDVLIQAVLGPNPAGPMGDAVALGRAQ